MKLSLALAGLISAVSAASLPSAFTLVAEGGYTVLTDGSNAFLGSDSANYEILILNSAPNGAVSFTSKNQSPTGWQNLYVVEQGSQPVGLTSPHSGAVPQGATINGFGVDDNGYFTQNNKSAFSVLQTDQGPTKKLFWEGEYNATFFPSDLYVKPLNTKLR
ncbi:hypothetical protein Plec18167_006544 [Paecilomyces lecythidis]|uniref:Uncharacterized protein n=1 Tax=Paecilomyces lecythidis TaxID=3004212 RepID=A0ABR3XB94_9EURO